MRNLIKNIYSIRRMHFELDNTTYCRLGKNTSTKTVIVDMELGDYIPDLLDIEDIRNDIEGGMYTNEELLSEWRKRLEFIGCKSISIRVESKAHFNMYIEG